MNEAKIDIPILLEIIFAVKTFDYSNFTTSLPPRTSPRLILSKALLILCKPNSTSKILGNAKSPFSSSVSNHKDSGRPTWGNSWYSLIGNVCHTILRSFCFGEPARLTKWLLSPFESDGGVDGGDNDLVVVDGCCRD